MEWNRPKHTPKELTKLKREELRYILTKELEKDSADIDDTLVRILLSELESRGKDPALVDDEDVVVTCEKFYRNIEKEPQKQMLRYQGLVLKVASVVLVLGILFFALPGVGHADNVRDVLTWWSDSVFQFILPGERPLVQEYSYETDHPGLQQIYDAVKELGVDDPVVPRWVPDGFKLVELKAFPMSEDASIYACLNRREDSIIISIINHSKQNVLQYEKDAKDVYIWDLSGREHYVISNKDEWTITWIGENVECTVITDCTQEDVYKMIKSIYTSEG